MELRVPVWLAVLAAAVFLPAEATAEDLVGPNLAVEGGFERIDAQGRPSGWKLSDQPAASAKFGIDEKVVLAGKRALRIEVPAAGSASVQSVPIAVQGGKTYLFSIGFRSEGFGKPGAYSGVDSSTQFQWFDPSGKPLGQAGGVAFPYHPSDWDLRDCFVTVPENAAGVAIGVHMGNHSQETAKQNIPSTLWIDGVQLREYRAPPTPDWAKGKVQRIVEGGWDASPVKTYDLSGLNYAGGKWSARSADSASTFGTALVSPESVGRGIMAHSPYFPSARPGLYRAVLRCKIGDLKRREAPGFLQIGSELASTRGTLTLLPQQFSAAGQYQEFALDFILRTPGYWMFLVHTEGNQPLTADCVRVFPLALFPDRQLLDIFPGSDGQVRPEVRPKRDGPFTTLLVSGLGYDRWRIVPALRLSDYRAKITNVFVQRGTAQTFLGFPATAEELFAHDLVCLCNVDASCLSLQQKRMLVEYVRRGGGLLLLGGHKALDRGGTAGSVLEELMPAACPADGPRPLVRFPAGAPMEKAADHPVTRDLDLSARPLCYWLHPLAPVEGSQTLLRVDGKPAVLVGQFGKGRVACVGMTCFGDPAPGSLPFWQWSPWVTLLRDLCWWTAGRDEHFP